LVTDSSAGKAQRTVLEGRADHCRRNDVLGRLAALSILAAPKDRAVLADAIRTGAACRDFFGTAYGQHDGSFDGFRFGSENIQLDGTLLLIEPEAAKQYEAAHSKPEAAPQDMTGTNVAPPQPGRGGLGEVGSDSGGEKAGGPPQPKSFRGIAEVAPATAKMRLVEIADEILSVLISDPNAQVKVTLEIDAGFPDGAKDHIKRAVSENAVSLGLKNAEWE
jgi:hypothetical protein